MELSIISTLASVRQNPARTKQSPSGHSVRRYLSTSNMRLLISDKDKKFVLCREEDFLRRATDFLNQSQAVILPEDPTPAVLRKTKKIITLPGVTSVLSGRLDPPSNVACPRLFFEAKTHKESWLLRPLVNKRSHPTYFLEKALARLLGGLLPSSSQVVSSSVTAKERLCATLAGLNPDTYTFYKMDVVALYPLVLHFEAVMLANTLLIEEGFTAQQVLEVREALLFITEHNYFRCNGKIYLQKQGMPMGSPLSAVLAELIMRCVEHSVFKFPLTIAYPLIYLRYVDDILLVWQDTEDSFRVLEHHLSKMYVTIHFMWEKEVGRKIAFLDLHIQKSQEGLKFSVYHKFGNIPPIIPATACQPQQYVNAAIAPLIRRAFLLPSTQHLINTELEAVCTAVYAAGFSASKYIHVKNRVMQSLFPATTLRRPRDWTTLRPSLPYCGRFTAQIFRQNRFRLPIAPRPCLRRILCNDRDAISTLEKSGVYSVPLQNPISGLCTNYIGATTRMLAARISEHQRSVALGNCNTELSKLVIQQHHIALWNRVEILKRCDEGSLVYIWEAILTKLLSPCNSPTLDLPDVWINIYRQLKNQQ
ncbi:uncharacterized protein LOC111632569 [Centruroides sculpturatus]|uniref:uncharacterized protein LOC111632569 n=1 Tax=Centruroides sculpturatus TaxID=218467 RepID=UPI000C6CB92B|nr:uncharacterized protein LOC111632569 [Centruroides sculpturatus]